MFRYAFANAWKRYARSLPVSATYNPGFVRFRAVATPQNFCVKFAMEKRPETSDDGLSSKINRISGASQTSAT